MFHHTQVNKCNRQRKWTYKNHQSISIDMEKAFDKILHALIINVLGNVGLGGTHLNIIRVVYEKPTVSIILNGGEK